MRGAPDPPFLLVPPATLPTIAIYNRFFDRWPGAAEIGEAPAFFAWGPASCAAADAVVFHLPTLGPLPGRDAPPFGERRAPQLWVGWCMESTATCPLLPVAQALGRFDVMMTYQRGSDIWCPYFGPGTVPHLLAPPAAKSGEAPVLHLQSNLYDRSGRNAYAAELMRHLRVDSCGTVLRNRDLQVGPGFSGRSAMMARYKFTLAFENSFAADYVSDKFFDVLAAGSVPVYRGAREVAELAPAPGSYVDAADFASPAELASHLRQLDADDAAYSRLHAWRRDGFSPAFRAHLERLAQPPFARLAALVQGWMAAGSPPLPPRPSAVPAARS